MSYLYVFPRQGLKKNSPHEKNENFNEKTTVINGSVVRKVSPAYDFLKNNESHLGNFQQKSVFPKQGSKIKCKNTGEPKRSKIEILYITAVEIRILVELSLFPRQ